MAKKQPERHFLMFLIPLAGDRFAVAPGQIVAFSTSKEADKWADDVRARRLRDHEQAGVVAGDIPVIDWPGD